MSIQPHHACPICGSRIILSVSDERPSRYVCSRLNCDFQSLVPVGAEALAEGVSSRDLRAPGHTGRAFREDAAA